MTTAPITFSDGDAYELSMGVWSRLAGTRFLDWLDVPRNLQWVDIGCGNGAFTELIVEDFEPSSVWGVDISEGQIEFARKRLANAQVKFQIGSADGLPYEDNSRDVAAMALVLFFTPEPRKAVEEMCRVVRPGGVVASYLWDSLNGGFPYEPVQRELAARNIPFPLAPRVEISRQEATRQLWIDVGLEDVQTETYVVYRTFKSFSQVWKSYEAGSIGRVLGSLDEKVVAEIKKKVRAGLPADNNGAVTYPSQANCVKGIVPESQQNDRIFDN